ncbi:MAG: hypothetical protein AAF626_13045 [Pseudomonadota bacterium]
MIRAFLTALIASLATNASAEIFRCEGDTPSWRLDLTGDNATLQMIERLDLKLTQSTTAEGRDWPRAFTLESKRDTTIALIELGRCRTSRGVGPLRAHVMTQSGDAPILLTGCCWPVQ